MMKRVDLNCDMGESFGAWHLGMDEEILKEITSANVACGFHASDPDVMHKTVEMATRAGVAVGAHPGYPDLVGFGRRPMALSPSEVYTSVLYQIGALDGFCRAAGCTMQHVKPHGAMYNTAVKDPDIANAIVHAILDFRKDLILFAPAGSQMAVEAEREGLRVAYEVFADRAYEEDGSLVSRKKPGAMITDEDLAVKRVIRMVKEGKVEAITGKDIEIQADSICVHGDGSKALAFAGKIREALKKEQIEIISVEKFL